MKRVSYLHTEVNSFYKEIIGGYLFSTNALCRNQRVFPISAWPNKPGTTFLFPPVIHLSCEQ